MNSSNNFDTRYGQQLCDMLYSELGFVCNFMDNEGRIVASSERGRVGHIHSVAARIMRGEIDEYEVFASEAAQSETIREGVNMGIDFDGARLISFSIAGPLDVVRPVARLVRFCVTSLLRVRLEETGFIHQPEAPAENTETPQRAPDAFPTPGGNGLMDMLSHASESIERSRARLYDAVGNIDQGITVFDSEMRLVTWNRRFLELLNLPSGSIAFGTPLKSIVRKSAECAGYAPGEIEGIVDKRMALVRLRSSHHFEHAMPDGRVLEFVDRPLPNGGFVTTYTDVTRRHQDEAALRAAYDNAENLVEERTRTLREFLEFSSDWFWEQDAELRFTEFSGHSTEKLQRSKSGFFGLRRWDLPISGITATQISEHIATCKRHEPFRDFEYIIPNDAGVPQYYSVSGTPNFSQEGTFLGYRGVGRNVTDLRLAELAIKDSERQLAQIVDGSSIPSFVIDAEHRVTHWNRACAKLTGISAEQMLGSGDVWRAFYPTQQPTMADLVLSGAQDAQVAKHYQKFSRSDLIAGAVEAENFHPNLGETGKFLYFTAAPLRGADGDISGALETIQDVTEKKRDQLLLEDRTAALQEAYSGLEKRVDERTEELSLQLHFMQQLIEAIPGPVYYKDADSHYLGCNSAYEKFIGLSSRQIIGKTPRDIASRDLAETYLAADRKLLQNPGKQIYENKVRYANGEMRDVMFHKATFTRPDGSVGGIVGLMLDITERKRMEDNLRQTSTVFESCAEGVSISTPNGSIIAVNPAFTDITGYAADEVIGRNPRMLQSGRHSKSFYRELWGCVSRDGRWQGEIWNRRKNGEIFPEWISITAVRDTAGQVTNYVATFSDITEQKRNEERIQQLAFSDPLTGLPNRRLLLDRLQHALITSVRNKRHGALLFIDLDDFKAINDTQGHDMGDLLLQQVALRLSKCVREGDTVARLGGDEFVVILEDLGGNLREATGYAESVGTKILQSLNEPYALLAFQYHGTPSIGITMFGDEKNTLEELLKQADLAMYRAKGSGRNALRFFDPEMQSIVSQRVAMEDDLRKGLLQNQFILHYQPQVNHIGKITGVEALLRWNHPERGMVPPNDFITLAEETGMILPIGLWVLETACAQLSVWAQRAETSHLTIAVNVSARQFRHLDFVNQVQITLERSGADPSKLKLELTESVLLDDIEDVISKMNVIKVSGVCFSLDDFGTGYSSLSYLKRLPLDQLKIDQSFVRDVLVNSNDAAIARTIVGLAHSLGIGVIAEGVETEAQLLFLAEHGCHAYQGYFFSRPLPIDNLEKFLELT